MNVNIDFNTINHAALMDSFSQLTTSHKQVLPAWDKMAESQGKQETSEEHLNCCDVCDGVLLTLS